ncbi:MAG: DUF1462 family protein [Syntrophomonadaceae bacterium]|nr:DUF1462 family protein [Syntrophomonadaceae bacterium]
MGRILIEVFDGINMGGCACSCGNECSLADVKGEYEALVKAIQEEYSEEVVETRYIDTTREGLAKYPVVARLTTTGYSFPITVINGKPRLAGNVHIASIFEIINEIISGEYR